MVIFDIYLLKAIHFSESDFEIEFIDFTVWLISLLKNKCFPSFEFNDILSLFSQVKIKNDFGNNFLPDQPNNYTGKKAKNAQEAHEAIRPTDINRKPYDIKKYVNSDQFKLYDLIWSRALSSQMKPAEFDRNTILISTKDNNILCRSLRVFNQIFLDWKSKMLVDF